MEQDRMLIKLNMQTDLVVFFETSIAEESI